MKLNDLINFDEFNNSFEQFKGNKPFDWLVCDNFFRDDVALDLSNEFPDYDDEIWHPYNNALENKKLLNTWNAFPELTYKALSLLNSQDFIDIVQCNTKTKELFSDDGLNGGGWHIHKKGGKLNVHLDYSVHPKLKLQRKYNLIIYLENNWDNNWGGGFGLWSANTKEQAPDKLIKLIPYKFNRAIFFDTTQNSWHGLPDPINCPENKFRKSLALYYLTAPQQNIDQRGKALFSPTAKQKNDKNVLKLIKDRSNIHSASNTYEA